MKYQSDLLNKGLLNDKIEITIKKAPIQTKPALKRYNNSVSPSKDSLVKLRYDMQKNYLENYRIMNNTPFKRTDSPSVVKDLSGDLVQRKLLLDSINKTHSNHHSEK